MGTDYGLSTPRTTILATNTFTKTSDTKLNTKDLVNAFKNKNYSIDSLELGETRSNMDQLYISGKITIAGSEYSFVIDESEITLDIPSKENSKSIFTLRTLEKNGASLATILQHQESSLIKCLNDLSKNNPSNGKNVRDGFLLTLRQNILNDLGDCINKMPIKDTTTTKKMKELFQEFNKQNGNNINVNGKNVNHKSIDSSKIKELIDELKPKFLNDRDAVNMLTEIEIRENALEVLININEKIDGVEVKSAPTNKPTVTESKGLTSVEAKTMWDKLQEIKSLQAELIATKDQKRKEEIPNEINKLEKEMAGDKVKKTPETEKINKIAKSEETEPGVVYEFFLLLENASGYSKSTATPLSKKLLERKLHEMKLAGYDINTKDKNGKTMLIRVAENGLIPNKKEVVEWLIKQPGIDLNAKDPYGNTALLRSINNESIAKILIIAGADVKVKNSIGNTLMMSAIDMGQSKELLKLLIEKGANLNLKGYEGKTALMYAVEKNKLDIVTLLIEAGADKNITSDDDKTAFDIAKEKELPEIIKLLSDHLENKKEINPTKTNFGKKASLEQGNTNVYLTPSRNNPGVWRGKFGNTKLEVSIDSGLNKTPKDVIENKILQHLLGILKIPFALDKKSGLIPETNIDTLCDTAIKALKENKTVSIKTLIMENPPYDGPGFKCSSDLLSAPSETSTFLKIKKLRSEKVAIEILPIEDSSPGVMAEVKIQLGGKNGEIIHYEHTQENHREQFWNVTKNNNKPIGLTADNADVAFFESIYGIEDSSGSIMMIHDPEYSHEEANRKADFISKMLVRMLGIEPDEAEKIYREVYEPLVKNKNTEKLKQTLVDKLIEKMEKDFKDFNISE